MGTVVVSPVETPLPQDPKEAVAHLHERIRDLNEIVLDLVNSFFYKTHVEPIRPRDGMIRRADGTDWNPGDGEGLYMRIAGSWVKLSPAASPVLSVFTRTGAVVAASGDYTAALVTSAFDKSTDNDVGAQYIDIGEITVPTNPSANVRRLFLDSATGELSVKDSSGTVLSLEKGNTDEWDTP